MIKGLLGIKRTIIIFICIVAWFASCTEKPDSRSVSISIVWAKTNYHVCDSLQQLAGYYPARIYLALVAYNMSKDTLFFPIQERYDTLVKSSIELVGDMSSKLIPWENGHLLLPKDTATMLLIVNLSEIPEPEEFTTLHNFIKDVNMRYKMVKSDTLLSKYPMPDSVIFNIDRNIKIEFLDIEDLGTNSQWL